MEIVRKPIIDWESVIVRFIPEHRKEDLDKQILSWIQQWSKERVKLTNNAICCQVPLEYGITAVESDGTVTLLVGWLCEESLPVFEKFLQQQAVNIALIEIGLDFAEIDQQVTVEAEQFIHIPGKFVMFEDGKEPFEICKQPVLFPQFEKFVNETNYVTTNEKTGNEDTFRENDLLPPIGDPSRNTSSVTCISYNDAIAYCKWANLRLPTEAEWMAAHILDWTEYDDDVPDEVWDRELSRPEALKKSGPEWTSEYDPKSDQAIVRYGPHYFLEPDWKKTPNKIYRPVDYTELCLQFRVCKI